MKPASSNIGGNRSQSGQGGGPRRTRLLLALAIILVWVLAPARPALAQAQRFTTPWTVENALRKSDAMIYESDCHEGNRGLANILSAARAEEKRKD